MDYTSANEKLTRLHYLINKRGDYNFNLLPHELEDYILLIEWYENKKGLGNG